MKQQTAEIEVYAQMGIAALIPGMQYMLERMQKELDGMRAQLGLLQIASPAKRAVVRRIKLHGRADAPAQMHPRDPRHPEHAKWVAKLRKTAKKRWAGMTKAEQAKHLRKMSRGRMAKAKLAAMPAPSARQQALNGGAIQ